VDPSGRLDGTGTKFQSIPSERSFWTTVTDLAGLGPLRIRLAIFASYLAVAAIYTFPLLTNLATYFPGGKDDKDVFGFIWNNWWTYYAVTHLHAKPYLTEYIFAPSQIDLRLHTFGLLYGLLSIPVIPVLGPVATLNAQVFLTIALNGYSSFRLIHYLTRSPWIGFVSGLLVSSAPAIDFHLEVGRPSCAALWPAIYVLYFSLRLLDKPTPAVAAALAASVVGTLMADQQVLLFCCFLVGILSVHMARMRRRVEPRFLLAGAAVLMIAALPAYLLYYRPLTRDLGYTVPWIGEARTYSVPLWVYTSPRLVWGAYGTVLPLAFIAALILVRRYRELWPWALGSVAFIVLTMGPVFKGSNIPLPFALVQRLPGMSHFRAPYRFQIPAVLVLSVTAGITLTHILGMVSVKTGRRLLGGITVVIVGDLVAHRLPAGFSIQTMPSEPIYAEIARDPRDCLVLEIPVGIRTGTDRIGPGEALSFYQPTHRKRLINGFAARVPLVALDYYRKSPALMLFANEAPPSGDVEADLRHRLRELHVGYVVVHPDMIESSRLRQVLDLLERVDDLAQLPLRGDVIAFRRAVDR
jgi:hypothetical protein